jgi:hypothetical protein
LRCDSLVKYKVALKDDGTPIHVNDATNGKDYLCPKCMEIVRRKAGNERKIHFFHKDKNAHDHDIQSVIHDETRELIYVIFRYLIDVSASFVWTYECKDSNIKDNSYQKYDKIPYSLNSHRDKRLLVANYRTKYDFLKGMDDVKWEASFENSKFRPDVSLIHDNELVLPFEIYYSNEDSDAKTAWYKANNINVVKIDVSTSAGVKPKDIRALREDWDNNENPNTIFDQLKVTIIYNPPITCLIPQILTTTEMLRDNYRAKLAEEEDLRRREIEEQERLERERVKQEKLENQRREGERIQREWREKFEAQNQIIRKQAQSNKITIENKMVKEIKKNGITEMEEVIREIHRVVKVKIRNNTALDDHDIALALQRCRFIIDNISHNLEGNSALRSALVLNIYNNQ